MPRYAYVCEPCEDRFEATVPVSGRDGVACPTCLMGAKREWSTPHVAAIGGIPNKVNRHWNEAGKAHDTTGRGRERRDERREWRARIAAKTTKGA